MRYVWTAFIALDLVAISVLLYVRSQPGYLYVYSGIGTIITGWGMVFAIAAVIIHAVELRHENRKGRDDE